MLTNRQEKLLNFLVKEYIDTAEPVGSLALKKVCDLDVSGATIRNDLQALTEEGYITQPHTSAGRIPTKKAYRHFADTYSKNDFIPPQRDPALAEVVRQIKQAHQEMAQEMQQMQELMQILENDNMFEILITIETWHKKI